MYNQAFSSMRLFILNILLLFSTICTASDHFRIAVLTDIHYLSPKLMDGGYAVEDYMLNSGRMIQYTPAILDSVLVHIAESEYDDTSVQCLLICGDLTKDGELESHNDIAEKLKPLKDKGMKIYVIPGNHDINMLNAKKYIGNKTEQTKSVTPDHFAAIYQDYGFNEAFSQDSSSLSYAVVLDKDILGHETWLICIDAARYEEYTTHSISAGRIKPETEAWVTSILEKAREQGASVYGMMHWGLTEHFPLQSEFMSNFLVDDWKRLADKFADLGMEYIFTGHNHANDITRHTSPTGNSIYDIETGTLSSYPFSYRIIDDNGVNLNIKTHRIESLPEKTNLSQESKAILTELAQKLIVARLNKLAPNIDETKRTQLSGALAQLFIIHLAGDEENTENFREIVSLFGEDYDADKFQFDYFPADNNVTISN